jgi:sarcosine oxidase
MSTADARVIVVGLGAMGSAACWHLARRGIDVVGIDAFDVPHARGSSHGESRIIRACYFEHPDYVPLLARAFELWHELARESGRPVIQITGGLFLGDPRSPLVSGSLQAGRAHGIPHEHLTGDDLRRRFPQFAASGMEAVFEPGAGLVRPEEAIAAHMALATRHGARVYTGEPLLDWQTTTGGGVIVTTAARTIQADALILCVGAWSGRLVAALAPQLTVTRQAMVWVEPEEPESLSPGAFPVWAMQHDAGDFHYGFPLIDATRGLKLGRHVPGPIVDPDAFERAPSTEDGEQARSFLRRYIPCADGPVRSVTACLYTSSPDRHFIVDRHPSHAQVCIACGFSGHGFKFASVIGEALADLALDDSTALPIDFLRWSRFH